MVTAWNGLAIAALAEHGVLTGAAGSLAAARRRGRSRGRRHLVDGRLRRASRDGVVGAHAGVLEDYGDLAEGLLALHQATGDGRWLERSPASCSTSSRSSSSTTTAGTTPRPTPRRSCTGPFDPADGPTPAGIAAAAGAAVTYSALAGSPRHRELGEAALGDARAAGGAAPRAAGWAAAIGEALLAGPLEVAVSGPAGPRRDALAEAARRSTSPGAVVVVGEPDAPACRCSPAGRRSAASAAAYVCRGFVCRAPGRRRVRSERSDGRVTTAADRLTV